MRWMPLTGVLLYGLLGAPASAALPAADDVAQGAQGSVATRARVVSVDPAPGSDGKRYIRLQLLPRARLPFSTLTFRVRDPALLDGIAEGGWVKFTAERLEGENTLTSVRVVDPCQRFQPCD